jgi:TonB-linked SusC/RagA family outer membrane protein
MKKNGMNVADQHWYVLRKAFFVMKLTLLILLITTFGLMAGESYSQETRITLNLKNVLIKDVLLRIENSSEYFFIYNNQLVDVDRKVSINVDNQKISDVLRDIFQDQNVDFQVTDRKIVLAPHATESQQQKSVSGKVSDSAGGPLPGVSVVIKGTTMGTITDGDGKYSMKNIPANATLVFSFVGMKMQEITVAGKTTINVTLTEESVGLDEVVAVGYGSKRKKDLTGSISTVQTGEMEKINSLSPQFALQGNTTGVRIVNTSGDPNAAPKIYIRGVGTWQGSGQPLYVIDGQIITPPQDGNTDVISAGNLDTPPNLWSLVNPNDIESMSVLKDASAAAIYGSRGANGVIIITTKRGKKGDATIEFNAQYGVQNIPTYKMQNTQQYVDLVNEMYANNSNPDISIEKNLYGRNETNDIARRISYSPQFDPSSPYSISSRQTYDWQKDLVRSNATDNQYDLKLSGGTDKIDYYTSVGYRNQESNFIGGGFEQYTGAINLNAQAKKWLKIGVNYKFSHQKTDLDDQTDLVNIANVAPWQPIYDSSTKSGYANVIDPPAGDWQPARIYGQGSKNNYLALTNLNRSNFTLQRQIGQGYFEILPIPGLTLRGSLNLDLATQDRKEIAVYANSIFETVGTDPAKAAPSAPDALASMSDRVNKIFNYQADFTATYDKSFGKHRINLTSAVQDQYHIRNYFDYIGQNITNIKNLDKISYGSDLANNNSFTGRDEKYWFGIVGRASYIYGNKYYLDLSYRRDASSGFSKDYRWGNFYSVSGAWRISDEWFMQDLTWLNDLKLRGGWGQAGNDEAVVGRFAYLSGAGGQGSYSWGSGNGNGLGNYYIASGVNGFPNASLTWEVVETTYFGFDASMFKNKLSATVEVFNRKTKGIQQYVNLPLSVGTDAPAFNIGALQNKGVDIMLGYNDKWGDFTYNVSGNISFLKNEVTSLYNNQPLYVDGLGRIEKGRSVGTIWGYKVGGVFQNTAEINNYYSNITDQFIANKNYVAPGDLWFQNVGGNPTEAEPNYSTTPDKLLNTYDQTDIGNTIPGYTYGIDLSAGWKSIDFSLNFYGEGDVQKYNEARAVMESMDGLNNFTTSVQNRWTTSNTSTKMPRAVIGDPAGNNRYSDRFVESAAFFRLNTWQLGYSIPDLILKKMNYAVKSIRLFISGSNNIYLSKWSTLDPVNDRKPLPRTFNIGLKAKF